MFTVNQWLARTCCIAACALGSVGGLIGCAVDSPPSGVVAPSVGSGLGQTQSFPTELGEFSGAADVAITVSYTALRDAATAGEFLVTARNRIDGENQVVSSTMIGVHEGAVDRRTNASRSLLLERGGSRALVHPHTVREPGVYLLRVFAQPDSSLRRNRSRPVRTSGADLWLVIDTNTAWTAKSWEAVQRRIDIAARPVEFGSYGRFVTPPPTVSARITGAPAALAGSTSIRFTYGGVGTQTGQRLPAGPGVPVAIRCIYPNQGGGQTLYTDANGRVSFGSGSCYLWGATPSLLDAYVSATGLNGAAPGYECGVSPGAVDADCRFGNDYAAYAFVRVRAAAAIGAARFARSRPRISVWASTDPTDTVSASVYTNATDRITIYAARALDADGEFVAAHEYGHAFQYVAIEPWGNYYCSANGQHDVFAPYTVSCALVEGFADFFGAWVAQDRIPTFGNTYTEYYFEQNGNRFGAGESIEGAFAAFLLDLVDGPSDPDGIGGDDETLQLPANFVATSFAQCDRVGFLGSARMDGSDAAVYCFERVLDEARSFAPSANQPSWRTNAGKTQTLPALPSGYDKQKIRAAWLWNFYNSGSLQ